MSVADGAPGSRERIGQQIRTARVTAGVSLAVFAKDVGVAENTIRNWEEGRNSPPADRLLAISRALDCSIHEILGLTEQELRADVFIVDEETEQALEAARTVDDIDRLKQDPPLVPLWFRVPRRYRVEHDAEAILGLEQRASAKLRTILEGNHRG